MSKGDAVLAYCDGRWFHEAAGGIEISRGVLQVKDVFKNREVRAGAVPDLIAGKLDGEAAAVGS